MSIVFERELFDQDEKQPLAKHIINYRVFGNGLIDVNHQFIKINTQNTDIPRFGLKFQLPVTYNNLTWFGRGPFENYSDRNTAAFVDRYSSKVADQYFPYIRPQENGYKTDVRWASLENKDGEGILVQSNELFGLNAQHYLREDFESKIESGDKKNRHTIDVVPRDLVAVNVDFRQLGVGGDNSWGARPHPQYRLSKQGYVHNFKILPYSREQNLDELILEIKSVDSSNSGLGPLPPEIFIRGKKATENNATFLHKAIISLKSSPGTNVYFTTDGSTPNKSSNKYTKPFKVGISREIKAISYNQLGLESPVIATFSVNKIGYPIQKMKFLNPPIARYSANGLLTLFDKLRGSDNYRDGRWLGYNGEDFSLEINFKEPFEINEISIGILNNASWLSPPVFIAVIDESGEIVSQLDKSEIEALMQDKSECIIPMKGHAYTYLKIIVKCTSEKWMFIDEVTFNLTDRVK